MGWQCVSRSGTNSQGEEVLWPFCTEWRQLGGVDVGVTAQLPSAGDAVELYAWGFAAVLSPVLLAWIGRVIIRGIELIR